MSRKLYTRKELVELTGISHYVIGRILRIEAYKNEIRNFHGEITANSLYELIKKPCREMILSENIGDEAIYAMKRISEEATGDRHTWIKECGFELKERRKTRSGRILYDIIKGA